MHTTQNHPTPAEASVDDGRPMPPRPIRVPSARHVPLDDADLDETTEPAGADEERRMINFLRRWHRFGGGNAGDIFVEFGLREREFFSRALELLHARLFPGMTEDTAEYIRKVCRWRLSVAST